MHKYILRPHTTLWSAILILGRCTLFRLFYNVYTLTDNSEAKGCVHSLSVSSVSDEISKMRLSWFVLKHVNVWDRVQKQVALRALNRLFRILHQAKISMLHKRRMRAYFDSKYAEIEFGGNLIFRPITMLCIYPESNRHTHTANALFAKSLNFKSMGCLF